ncbi:hypothetical protein K505DRAFT_302186 [Melanomma pulvis-pyrius CBS 109.77]|uniref:Rhodopsin domain-containing protein n=1 Tax=Melanomma pulvis-pyrius CBS 109.77 TaxID=1314802 RepID=A0A6A6XFZ2_9PLEO|nr:hypothetical protein K505DRAFT_302186 [Melanomma pulvis-pyrius CBS 109.77]
MAIHDQYSIARRGEQQANVAIAFLVLTWLFILLRIWTRTYVIANFGWDDTTMVFAGILYTVYCATMIVVEANGGGTHISDVKHLWTIVGEATYIVTVMMLKISLGIFFARIVVASWQLMTIYITVAVNVFSSTASFFYALLRCGANLDLYVYKQLADHCTPRGLDRFFAYQQASFTTLTDGIFICLPIFILWNASMDLRSKISVGFILSLAALGCVCSLVRFQYVDGLTQIEDFFWNATNIATWSTIEPGAGIIAGCLATLRPFLKFFVVKARLVRSYTSHSAKEVSRSFRANKYSSKARSAPGSNAHHKIPCRSRRGTNAETFPPDQSVELKSDVRKKNESTEFILTQTDGVNANEPWPSQPEHRLESNREIPQNTRTTWTMRSNRTRRGGDGNVAYSLEKPLPPLPPAFIRRDEDVV